MNEGLAALERIGKNKYQTTVANITGFERITISVKQDNKKDYQIIENELKAKGNLVSMCENLAKLVGLKEKDYVELETLITKKLKALKVIVKTLDIRVSMNKMGQCLLEDNHCIYAIPRSTYDLLSEVSL